MDSIQEMVYKLAQKKVRDLFPNMHVLSRLYVLLRSPEADLAEAVELIRSDGVLAAGVLRLSNSAYYGREQPNLVLEEAVQQVGFRETLRMVGDLISRHLFMRDLSGYGLSADEYWTYSYYCAAFMEIAASISQIESEKAYLLGLLHGIGRVVNNEVLHDKFVEILWDPNIPGERWEKVMGLTPYPQVGADLLRDWGFPDDLCEPVERQLDPDYWKNSLPSLFLDFARQMVENNRPAMAQTNAPWIIVLDHPIHRLPHVTTQEIEALHERTLEHVARLKRALSI